MEIKDLMGLEKPLTVLVQAFCDGCSSLFSPIINQIEANNQRKQKEADNNLERAKDSVVGCKVVTDKTISNISFTGLSLTDSGFELLSLIEDVKPNKQFVELLKNEVNKKYGDNVKIVPLV